jgi:hypothetical protein
MPGLPCDAVQRQRAAGNGLRMFVWNSQPHEDRPPVVDQRGNARHHLAPLLVLLLNPAQPHWFFNSSVQQQAEIRKMVSKGDKTAADAARLFKIHPATVSRLLARPSTTVLRKC